MEPEGQPDPPVRTAVRRPAAQSRRLIADAARTLFGVRGYAGATVRDVARESGVAEVVIYRHFGSKAGLFEHVMSEQLAQFIRDWMDSWRPRTPDQHNPPTDLAKVYVEGVFRAVRAQRGQLLALLAAEQFEPEVLTTRLHESSAVSTALDELSAMFADRADAQGWHGLDAAVTTRAVFGMVMSNALFLDWLYPVGRDRPDEQRIIDELIGFLLYGVTARP